MKKKMLLLFVLCATYLASLAQYPPISHIETNNVRATILGNGTCFVPQQGTYYEEWQESHGDCPTWEVPQGSGKETVFQLALWFGGLDTDDSLHVAAFQYGQVGMDYWSGPLKPIEGRPGWNGLLVRAAQTHGGYNGSDDFLEVSSSLEFDSR